MWMIDKIKRRIIVNSIIVLCAIMLFFASGCQKIPSNETSGNIVFLGDSITESYDLEKYFPGMPVINSGVWGNITDEVLSRLGEDVAAYNPGKVFLLIGINDVGRGRTNDDIAGRIEEIITGIKENCPLAEIYLISVYPLNISDFDTWYPPMSESINDVVDDLNQKLVILADDMDIEFIDMAPLFEKTITMSSKKSTRWRGCIDRRGV